VISSNLTKRIALRGTMLVVASCWGAPWAHDAKDFVKHSSNRDGKVTIFGGIEFKPFSNLTTKWVKSLMLDNLLWIILIDTTKNGTEDSFPMQAHLVSANKIA
jgi:hypothetical protein